MYQFSTDYNELYRLICAGHIAVGFVDYRFCAGDEPMRDVVQIKRHGEGLISVGARGISYGSVHPFECENRPEKDVFISYCRSYNLAFIAAQTTT